MDIDIQPKQKRKVTFEVDENEAAQIAGWLTDAINSRINTPHSSSGVREVMYAFARIRDNR